MSVTSSFFSSVGFSDVVSLQKLEEVQDRHIRQLDLQEHEKELEDPISLELIKNPVILHCGCILDLSSFQAIKNETVCPYRHPLFSDPLFITSRKINEWFGSFSLKVLPCGCIEEEEKIQSYLENQQKFCSFQHDVVAKDYIISPKLQMWFERKVAKVVLNCDHFEFFDEEKKELHLQNAIDSLDNEPFDFSLTTEFFYQAFFYTKSSKDYREVLKLYQKMGLQDRIESSLLYLFQLQIEEKKYEEALETFATFSMPIQEALQEVEENLRAQLQRIDRTHWINLCEKRIEKLLPHQVLERKTLLKEISSFNFNQSDYFLSSYYYVRSLFSNLPTGAIDCSEWGNEELLSQRVPIPLELVEFLASPCPIWEGKLAKETHFLFPIPSQIWAEGRWTLPTIEALESFCEEKKAQRLITEYSTFANSSSYVPSSSVQWAVLTRQVLPETVSKSGEDQERYLFELETTNYQIPPASILLLAYLWEMAKGEKSFFSGYTRVLDSRKSPEWIMKFIETKEWEISINPYKDGRFGTLGFYCLS